MDSFTAPIEVKYIAEPILVQKIEPQSEIPSQDSPVEITRTVVLTRRTDGRIEDVTGDVNSFGTGLKVKAPPGYHIEFIASPTLYKHGYMMVHRHILSPNDREEVIIHLYKFKEGDDIELPFAAVQMICYQTGYARIKQASSPEEEKYNQATVMKDYGRKNPNANIAANFALGSMAKSQGTRSNGRAAQNNGLW